MKESISILLHPMLNILSGYLLPEGKLFWSVDYQGNEEIDRSDSKCLELPMAVLINADSYSAAEFFAAALQEYEWATVVGTPSTGKSHFQVAIPLNDGSAVKITYRYYNPASNVSYEGIGIKPDEGCEVVLTEEELNNFYKMTHEEDRQLQKALEVLLGK